MQLCPVNGSFSLVALTLLDTAVEETAPKTVTAARM